jgi:cytochrome c
MSTPLAPFRARFIARHALLASLGTLAIYACHEATSGDGASTGTPATGTPGTGPDGNPAPDTGMPGPDGAGPSAGVGSPSEGMGNPTLSGAPTSGPGAEGPTVPGMLMGGAGTTGAVDPAIPVYEQDDPNLHPQDSSFERVEIPVPAPNVMAIDIDEQDRVYVLGRAGGLQIWYPGDGHVVNAGTIPVFSGNEDGGLSITLDPNFSTNGWAYVYYSSVNANQNVLSRFNIADDKIDLASERVMLTVPVEREVQNHAAGATDFDSKGNLYLSTGDNTNPFQSSGFSPHDERAGRRIFDAQRSAANSRDLRGKILRIKPKDDGTYDIPPGNLFAPGSDAGAPEIFVMGDRNPFRLAIDTGKDWLYWGEVGPDAGDQAEALTTRGPRGYDEFNQAKSAGFFGWPYCIANNIPYVHVDFGNLAVQGTFDCNAPVNASPNNTGARDLPPAQPAWIAYSYGTSPFPALGTNGGRSALIADIYRWKPGGSPNKLPRYYDGSVLLMEYVRGLMAEARTDDNGAIQSVDPFLRSFQWRNVIQARISPSGVFHVAQYGGGTGSNVLTGGTSTVYRINYVGSKAQ